ncbi:5-formyltetrahydrofolate cyclo-ligase [Paeniglutamicibacter gangotriensis]|uniref:5-formyltetrahydrofolate cyclo-ligase n=1 Tax=Paeniglutamicibacter gangotriensis Lz1y TaxID=1276920 RepID=M7NM32_9MICC|nr:5-formyltetrahydrofolate cyclo-ligase [Paeniglutamicibacter gangotriensis]EMQ99598.1 5-formyltetrahydrofolate cyclo-ligase [Paeniglutamicibacter gangotriensis Lz1y]
MTENKTKDEIRNRFRAQRRALGAEAREAQMQLVTGHLLPWLQAHAPRKAVTCFLSYGAEPPTADLLARLHEAGFTLYVPVCEPERQLSWTRWYPGVAMARSLVGPIDEPVGERFSAQLMEELDVILVPAQAVDVNGDRLGQGGGYYDRFIASLPRATRPKLLSIVFEHEFLEAGKIPVEPFDERVEAVVLPSGVLELTK